MVREQILYKFNFWKLSKLCLCLIYDLFWKMPHVHLKSGYLYFKCLNFIVSLVQPLKSLVGIPDIWWLFFVSLLEKGLAKKLWKFLHILMGLLSANPPSLESQTEKVQSIKAALISNLCFLHPEPRLWFKSPFLLLFPVHNCLENILLENAWINIMNHWHCSFYSLLHGL